MNAADQRYLIIAGQPKAGTTSLFDWLAQHPQITPARFKEARFFLDADYPLPRALGFDGTNLEAYLTLFEPAPERVMMEATPDYLYNETALSLATLLPHARIVVLRRDPVERMLSAFAFFQQRGLLPAKMSFDDYIALQTCQTVTAQTPVEMRALDHCRPEYIARWQEAFGDRLMVIEFEDLKRAPTEVLARVCAHIDVEVIRPAETRASNASVSVRSARLAKLYYTKRTAIAHAVGHIKPLRAVLRPISRALRGAIETKKLKSKPVASDASRAIITKTSQL